MAGFGELGSFDDRFALPEPTAAELAQAEQMRAKLAADHYFGNTPRKVLPAGYVESLPDLGPATTFGELSPGVDWANTLFGTGEGERFQMWPERMVRSGLTLPGDIASGAEPLLPPGLRREDYTDAAPPQRGSAEGIFGNRLFTPQAAQPNDPAYQRAQDLAGMSGGGMVFGELGGGKGAAASVGRDVRVLGKKIGSGEPFQHQLIDQPVGLTEPYIPPGPADRMQRPIEARIDAGLDRRANDRGLTSVANTGRTLLEDSSATGAPIAALERQRQRPVSTGFGELGPARNTMIENADLLKELAVQRRNRGESVGKSAPGWDFKRPDAPKGSWQDTVARTKAQWDVDKARAIAGFEDAAGPEPIRSPLLSKDDLEFIKGGAFYSDSATPGAPLSALEHAPKFYSALDRAVEALPEQAMTGSDWLGRVWEPPSKKTVGVRDEKNRVIVDPATGKPAATKEIEVQGRSPLPGVKQEELEHSGLLDFLTQNADRPVTKAEVQAHLAENGVKIGEVEKGAAKPWDQLSGDEQWKLVDRWGVGPNRAREMYEEYRATGEDVGDFSAQSAATKYHDYQLPGGENYREKLITLPERGKQVPQGYTVFEKDGTPVSAVMSEARAKELVSQKSGRTYETDFVPDKAANYTSSHWDEPNVLVHRRSNERDVGAGEGMQLTNLSSGNKSPIFNTREEMNRYYEALPESVKRADFDQNSVPRKPIRSLHMEEIQSDWHQQGRKNGYREPEVEAAIGRLKANKPTDADIALLQERVPNSTREYMDNRLPDAPFKKNWHELALKDHIREAAEKGFDRISWTPGEAQAARYDLSKQIKALHYLKTEKGEYLLGPETHTGQEAAINQGQPVPANKLADYVGKDVADKIIKGEGKIGADRDTRVLEGIDLKVGGEGMKGFYDKMIPDYLNKIGKPHGVQVQRGETAVDKGKPTQYSDYHDWNKAVSERRKAPVHYMDIPPSLKEQALKKGFSLFEDSAMTGAPLSALERAADQGFNLPLFHKTNKEFTEFKPNSHFGTTDQANMRAVGGGASIMPVMVRGENFRRMRDTGDWSEKKLKPLAGKHDGVVYLNRYEGIPQESFHRAAAEVGGFEKLDLLSDAQFKKLIPEAQDSYIVFDPKNVRSKFANFDPEAKNKSGLLLEDAAAPGAPLSALEHPGASYHALLDQPAGGAYKPTHAPEAAPAEAATAPAPRGNGPGGAGGGDAGLHEAAAAAARRAGARAPLEGLPTKALKIGDEHFVPGPIDAVHKVAEQYLAGRETPSYHKPPTKYHPLDEEHSRAIARAFDEMKHTPDDPATKASYDALIKETADQYQAIKKSGLKIEAITPDMPDPYAANPRLAAKDVADNNHLWYFPTDAGFGSNPAAGIDMATHPMMRKTGERLGGRELLANDMFRIVHDYFGHLKEGYGFRAAGEDNAWRSHASMYSDLARPAMTTETRGQNSWVNYGPHGESNRTASAADTKYADQKVGLMPEWTMRDRGSTEPTIAYHGSPYSFDKFDPAKIGTGEGNQAYGHGLYFAGHEPVSEWYRHQLAARRDPILERHGLDAEDGANVGVRLAATKGNPAPVIADLEKEIASLRSDGDTSKGTQSMIVRRRAMVNFLKDPERNPGHLYQVAIDHPQEAFLDWDKPLKEQPAALEAIRKVVPESLRKTFEFNVDRGIVGGNAYHNYVPDPPSGGTSKTLREAGVPGIKYLDQGSRGKGGGTSNYVTFSAPRILKKYGVPGLIGAGGFGSIAGDER